MTLRRRVGMAAAIAVAIAVVLVAAISYFVVRGQLVGQVDSSLRAEANGVAARAGLGVPFPTTPPSVGGQIPYAEVVTADGGVSPRLGSFNVPPSPRMIAVAAGASGPFLSSVRVGRLHLRVLVFQLASPISGQGQAAVIALSLSGVDHILSTVRLVLVLVCLGGIALAIVLGRLAAKRVLAPLAEVAATAQHISETEDLTSRIQVQTDDEVGRLATRFNAMLERLEASRAAVDESVRAQRQLVADASHELRTPVTSLRTNIELLLEHDRLDPEERRRMLTDVVEQTEELSALVGDLIELARGDLPPDSAEDVRLDQIVSEAVRRAQRNFPEVTFDQRSSPVLVEGMPDRLSRAVNNLLDNAARHSPPDGVVEVAVTDDSVRVRDHGPGVAEADMPYVFDRFYRGAGARGRQGSGLGLSIVRQVAQQHGGAVTVENASDGGAVFTLRLPASVQARPDETPAPGSGTGGLGDSRVTRRPEPLAELPEADDEQRDHDREQQSLTQRAAE